METQDNPSGSLSGPGLFVEDSSVILGPRIVRISLTDGDATDSSSEEELSRSSKSWSVKRVRRFVVEAKLPEAVKKQKKFRGVRQRKWGKWCAEIRDKARGRRLWLGTYDTAQEAAVKYDEAALRLHGPSALTNFHLPGNHCNLCPTDEKLHSKSELLHSLKTGSKAKMKVTGGKCYISPTGKKFRSKNEVSHILKTGSKPKSKGKANGKPSQSFENQVAIKLHGPDVVAKFRVAPAEKEVDSPLGMENATTSVSNVEGELKELQERTSWLPPDWRSVPSSLVNDQPPETMENQEGERPKRHDTINFRNPPESVNWISINSSGDIWKPVVDEAPVPTH